MIAALAVLLCAVQPATAEAQPPTDGETAEAGENGENRGPAVRQAVIPPGQEEQLANMLGRGATLPGQCQFARAQVDQSVISSTYTCPQGEVVVELAHPSVAASDAATTEKFAIAVREGAAPPEFLEGLLERIRAEEAAVEWAWTGASPVTAGPTGYRRIVTLSVLLAVTVAGWWLMRRRPQQSSGEEPPADRP